MVEFKNRWSKTNFAVLNATRHKSNGHGDKPEILNSNSNYTDNYYGSHCFMPLSGLN